MAYSYKGSISFGLIYIPVVLQASIKNNDIGFNMLDKKTLSRVKYKKTCVDCGDREVKQEDIVKGYEYEKDKYVVFEDSDFEKIKTKKDKSISIESFADLEDIDPIFYDKAYYVQPTGAEKAYSLLVKAMEETGKVGIAKTVLGTKETLIVIRVSDGQMLLNTMFFASELQKNAAKDIKSSYSEKEFAMAKKIIEAMSEKFDPEAYKDEYRERLQQAIDAKIEGREPEAPEEGKESSVASLMEALANTLSETKVKKRKAN